MKINLNTIKWIYSKIKSKVPHIVVLTLLSSAISYIAVKFALAARALIDSVYAPDGLFKSGIYIGVLILLQLALQIIYSLLFVNTEGKLKIALRLNVFNTLLKKDYLDVTKFHTGELLNRIENDAKIITSGIVNIIPNTIALLVQIILSIIVLFTLDKSLAVIFVVLIPIMLVATKYYSKAIKPLHKKYQHTNGIAHSFIIECLQNLLVLKSFANENQVTSYAENLQQDNYQVAVKRNKINLIGNVAFFLVLNVGFYFAMVWCVYKISNNLMTFGTLTAVLQLVSNVSSPFRSLAAVIPEIVGVIASSERLIELECMQDDKPSKTDYNGIYSRLKSINFNNITFSYDAEEVLSDVSVTIKKSEFTAISGASGIGKSTFLKLIMAILKPDKGNITIDLDNETKEIDASLRKLFAYVPQTNMLLSGTIYENIRFYKEDITKEQIIDAAKTACIWDFISELPDGLDTVLGEKGLGLSEGQIQRIAIARAIVQDSPILLLDEATSALDEETEKNVLNNLKEQKDRTCIVISHRPKVFDICDKIINISDKKITEM